MGCYMHILVIHILLALEGKIPFGDIIHIEEDPAVNDEEDEEDEEEKEDICVEVDVEDEELLEEE